MTKARDIADNAGKGGGASNVIINGAMKISQRATSAASITTSGYKTVDRWNTKIGGAGTWTQTQNAVTDLAGFRHSLKMACTTANSSLAASNSLNVETRLEGFDIQQFQKGTASAKKWALSFYVKSSKTGTYITELFDNNNNRHVNKSYTVDAANTWEHKKIIFDGDTSSPFANTNGNCLIVLWYLAAGTNYTTGTLQESWGAQTNVNRCVGQVNLADSTSNTWEITGVQLEVGDKCSDFQHEESSVTAQKCYRYYFQSPSYSAGNSGTSADVILYHGSLLKNASAWHWLPQEFPVVMRAAPSVTCSDGTTDGKIGHWTSTGGGSTVGHSPWQTLSKPNHIRVNEYATGGIYGFYYNYKADAEL